MISMIVSSVFGFLIVSLVFIYKYLRQYHGRLESLGIPIIPSYFGIGSPPLAIHKVDFSQLMLNRLKKYGKTYGRYDGIYPVLVSTDPEIIKSITVQNFECFTDTMDVYVPDKFITLDYAGGQIWKELRRNLSPTFTSGKMKKIVNEINKISNLTMDHIRKEIQINNNIDLKEIFDSFAINSISHCGFGVDVNAHIDSNEDLVKYGKEAFSQFRPLNWIDTICLQAFFNFKGLDKLLSAIPPAYNRLYDITLGIINQRKINNVINEDFIAKLMELIEKKKSNPNDKSLKNIPLNTIASQGIIFFAAGYETTSSTLTTLCYNLAMNPEIQQKLFKNIKNILHNHQNIISYDSINDMEFLEACIYENLRLNGPVLTQIRICVKDCEIYPGMIIKKGTHIDLPIYALHHDPEYFPQPDKFLPDRFLKENKDQIIPYTFRPFGSGPRICIGQRFAMVEMKIFLVNLLMNYQIHSSFETQLKLNKGDLVNYKSFQINLIKIIHNYLDTSLISEYESYTQRTINSMLCFLYDHIISNFH